MLCILQSFPYRTFLPQDRHYCIGFKGNRCAVKQGGIYDYIAIFPSDLHQSSRLRDWKTAPGGNFVSNSIEFDPMKSE